VDERIASGLGVSQRHVDLVTDDTRQRLRPSSAQALSFSSSSRSSAQHAPIFLLSRQVVCTQPHTP
jgi:hypothetical protein